MTGCAHSSLENASSIVNFFCLSLIADATNGSAQPPEVCAHFEIIDQSKKPSSSLSPSGDDCTEKQSSSQILNMALFLIFVFLGCAYIMMTCVRCFCGCYDKLMMQEPPSRLPPNTRNPIWRKSCISMNEEAFFKDWFMKLGTWNCSANPLVGLAN